MGDHAWVKHVVVPIDVYVDAEGFPMPLVDPELQDVCEVDNVVYGCNSCGQPLLKETYETPCAGDTPEEMP